MRKRAMSIGARLTAWSAAGTFFACLFLSAVFYFAASWSLHSEVDKFLEGEIDEFMLTVNEHGRDIETLHEALRIELGSRQMRDLHFRLFRLDGDPVVSSEVADYGDDVWLPKPAVSSTERYQYQTIHPVGEAFPYRTCNLRVTARDGTPYIAQAGYRLDRVQSSLRKLQLVCGVVLFLSTGVAWLVGRRVAEENLKPIRSLQEKAATISANSLSARIPIGDAGDELDQLAETINAMLQRIERHVLQMQQFTADASHEIRTPITSLRGIAELALANEYSVSELRAVLADSIQQYDQLTRIAQDLLFLARADEGHPFLVRETLNLHEVLHDVIDLHAPVAEREGISLTLVGDEFIEFDGDGGRLRQLFTNLVTNAMQHTPAGGQIVAGIESNATAVLVRVSDSGAGIPVDRIETIFDRFSRSERSRGGGSGGAGLGLAICKTIVEAHGGTISARSTQGIGTIFEMSFPNSTNC